MTTLETILAVCHLTLLAPLCVLGLHKAWMILLWSHQRQHKAAGTTAVAAAAAGTTAGTTAGPAWPRVTVQLPLYNERFVVGRLLRAVAALDYPRDRLEVQILDDSTDDTGTVIASLLPALPADLRVRHVRRTDRTGFKAGALAHGLTTATGEFIAVFDADFAPCPEFLAATIPHFADARVGLVQARWGHTNRTDSILTRVQALLLDGHFAVEQPARANNGCFFNFNGTAGVFRRTCIEDAGGWQHDTLTEDMDLSYRAQLRGWRFRYLPELCCPAELPADINGFLTQQHRWAKGSIQTGRKLLPRVFAARLPLLTKAESVFHLFGNAAFPILLGLILVALPLQLARGVTGAAVPAALAFAEGLPLILATLSVFAYYGLSQMALRRFGPATLLQLPLVLVLGAGASLNSTLAVLGGLRRDPGVFHRTPKGATVATSTDASYHAPRGWLPLGELLLGGWAATTFLVGASHGLWGSVALHGLFAVGLLWVGATSFTANRRARALLPAALLAGCSGGGSSNPPIRLDDAEPHIVACQATIGDEFARTKVILATRQGLGLDDLPSRAGMEFGVRVHPDGKRLVFARERQKNREESREIHLASLDGSVFDTRLTANSGIDDGPCWSPDGTAILFSSARSGRRHLWRMDADGQNPTPVTSGPTDDRDPDWHAAGIVFSRTDDAATPPRARLFVADRHGANAVPLTDGGTGSGPGSGDFEPAWSPDGQSVLFVRALAPGRQVLLRIAPGQAVPQPIGDGGGEDRFPRWSPRGDRIFVARGRPDQGIGGLRLFAMNADGGAPVLLFPDQRHAYLGFDPVPSLPAYPDLEAADIDADIAARGTLSMRLGVVSHGDRHAIHGKDGKVLGVRAQDFDNRKVAGILLTLDLPVQDPHRIAWLAIDVTGALTRVDGNSYLRLALRDFFRQRYDSVLEVSPADTALRTWSFQTASLRHVDRDGNIRLEVIGDASGGDAVDLLVDHIGVRVRLAAPK